MSDPRIYQIAITKLPFVGNKIAKLLIAYCGGAEAVFHESKKSLAAIPKVGERIINSILQSDPYEFAESDIIYLDKNSVQTSFFLNDENYPNRLKNYEDAPILLYHRGTANLNAERTVSIVGTRIPTQYGKSKTQEIVQDLKALGVQIISGMAYGIDSIAHQLSVQSGIENIAVMGTGINNIYPPANHKLAQQICENGALLTEFAVNSKPERENFPLRNRIIAGMSDVVIVIQSAAKGGSLITAEYANAYNKDVFALPGRTNDEVSKGCNHLIKVHKAHLLESVKDITYIMRWDVDTSNSTRQTQMFVDLSKEEQLIVDTIQSNEEASIDWLHHKTNLSLSSLANILLTLEFKGVVTPLPGKKFIIN